MDVGKNTGNMGGAERVGKCAETVEGGHVLWATVQRARGRAASAGCMQLLCLPFFRCLLVCSPAAIQHQLGRQPAVPRYGRAG